MINESELCLCDFPVVHDLDEHADIDAYYAVPVEERYGRGR